MKCTKLLAILVTVCALTGCQTWSHWFGPRLDEYEKNILKLKVDGVGIGSKPSELKKFPQLKGVPKQKPGKAVYEVYNPNPHISMMITWFDNNRLTQMEMRYQDGPVVNTLAKSGGWKGVLDYLEQHYGPPSQFGKDVKVVATMAGLDPATADFNGMWYFSQVYRQLNYVAKVDEKGGLGAITLTELPQPPKKKWWPIFKFKPKEQPAPPEEPNPGF